MRGREGAAGSRGAKGHPAEPRATPQPRHLGILLASAAAFALRVAAAIGIGKLPLSRTPQYDALEYLLWAQRIAASDFRWPPHPPHGPAYPYVLGALLAMGGGSLLFARIAQAAIGAATCLFAGLTASRWFGPRAGVATVALLAIYAPLIWLDVSIGSEGLLLFFLAAALWSATTKRRPLLAGALIGLAALARPTALIFLPLLLWLGKRRALIAAGVVAVILPVTIANWRASHAFIPIQAFGGLNVYLGDSPLRDGTASARPGGEWDALEAQEHLGARTLREIGAHPGAFARLLLRKSLLTIQNEEIRDTHSFYFFRDQVPLLRWLPGFTLLFAVAGAGAVTCDWRDRRTWIVALWIALAAASCIFLVVGARYRIPMAIGLALFGGTLAAARSRRRLAIGAAAGVLAAICTRLIAVPGTHNLSEEWALTSQSLTREGAIAEADDAARRAIEIDPSNALGWDARGSALAAMGRAEAVDAFRRAVSINPKFAAAHERLAMLLVQIGDVAGAAEEYRRTVAITPREVSALWALARLEGSLGRPAEGLEMARRAAALQTPGDDDWLVIAMLAAETRHLDEADAALAHVVEPSPRVEQVREILRRLRGSG